MLAEPHDHPSIAGIAILVTVSRYESCDKYRNTSMNRADTIICKFKIMCFDLGFKKSPRASAKRMCSGNEFHSTGPAQEKDRRP